MNFPHPHVPFLRALAEKHIEVAQAWALAVRLHGETGQTRKGIGEPYYYHVLRVAEGVAARGGSVAEVIAALLHDVLEDVTPKLPEYSPAYFAGAFGDEVVSLMRALTNVFTPEARPDLTRAERKAAETARYRLEPEPVRFIKLSDIADNAAGVVYISGRFARLYLGELDHLLLALASPEADGAPSPRVIAAAAYVAEVIAASKAKVGHGDGFTAKSRRSLGE
jgi:hypothetical protein